MALLQQLTMYDAIINNINLARRWFLGLVAKVSRGVASVFLLQYEKIYMCTTYPGLASFPEAVDFRGDIDLGAALFWRSVTA